MRYDIKLLLLSIYVATLNSHYKFNTRSKLYTSISRLQLLVLKITHEMFYCARRQKQTKIDVVPGCELRCVSFPLQEETHNVLSLPGWKNWNRQLQLRESNWLWHENRIIIIHPPFRIDLWTCQIFGQATNGMDPTFQSQKYTLCIYLTLSTRERNKYQMLKGKQRALSGESIYLQIWNKNHSINHLFKSSRLQ